MRGAWGIRIRTQLYLQCYCACRRHQDCHCGKRRVRYVAALFGQLSGKPLLCPYLMKWGLGRKAQWLVEELNAEHLFSA
jgi:hypothetical protein